MITVLITGDNMMRPEKFKAAIEAEFGKEKFDIRIKAFDFDHTEFRIDDGTQIPSGMCFEDPVAKSKCPESGVSEFYGEPLALLDSIAGVDVLIIHGAALPSAVLERADRLKYIIALRGGPANIDMDTVNRRGIKLMKTSGKNAPAVAEFALGALLDFERGISRGNAMLKEQRWWIKGADTCESHELCGKKFGFIGYGHIAQNLRSLLSAFNIEAFAYSPHVSDELLAAQNVKRLQLEELVASCDYVSLHSRAVKGAPPLMDAHLLGLMQSRAVLINTARGALVDYGALKEALRERRIRGAVLDVLGNEPFAFYRELICMDNVLVTPHIAGQSVETCERACVMGVRLLHQIVEEMS